MRASLGWTLLFFACNLFYEGLFMFKCTNCGKEFEGDLCPECGTKAEKELSPPPDCAAKPDENAPNSILQEPQRSKIAKLRTVVKLAQAQKWVGISLPLLGLFIPFFLGLWGMISVPSQAIRLVIKIVGSISIALAFVSLLFVLVLLYRKNITFGKKQPAWIPYILEDGRSQLICSAVVSFAVSAAVTVVIGMISKTMLASLEMKGNLNFILVSLLLLFPLGLFALCLLFNAAVCAVAQNACRALMGDKEIARYYFASKAKLTEVLNSVPVTKRAKRGQLLCWLSIGFAFVTAFAVVFPVANTNIFRVSKLDKLPLGASQEKVVKLLGTADHENNTSWEYYSENYMSVYRRQRSIEEKYTEALLKGDLKKIEELDKQSRKLAEETAGMYYRHITVSFDAEGLVFRVEMSYEYIPWVVSAGSADKHVVGATVMPASVPYEMLSTIQLSYRFAETNGDSYVHALLTDPTWNKAVEGAGTYGLTWEDARYKYLGRITLT